LTSCYYNFYNLFSYMPYNLADLNPYRT